MRRGEPTFPAPIFVGSDLDSAVIALLIPFFRGLLEESISLAGVPGSGNLSEWIRRFHKKSFTLAGLRLKSGRAEGVRFLTNVFQLLGRLLDPKNTCKVAESLEHCFPPKQLQVLEVALKAKDFKTVDRAISEMAQRAGLKMKFDSRGLFVSLRVMRAIALCSVLHFTHPLRLLQQVKQGDRAALLKLVQVDKLFLDEPAAAKIVRDARLACDHRFLDQLARAEQYRPAIRGKMPHRLILYAILALTGRLPNSATLFAMLDPEGKEFPSTEAFEKFCERCKKQYAAMQ